MSAGQSGKAPINAPFSSLSTTGGYSKLMSFEYGLLGENFDCDIDGVILMLRFLKILQENFWVTKSHDCMHSGFML